MSSDKTRFLVWIDLETDGLPTTGNGIVDYRNVNVLEFAAVLTDMDLNILEGDLGGYTEVVKMNEAIAANLRATPALLEMHGKNGLIQESVQVATKTLEDIDTEIVQMLSETGAQPGEFVIAGSGVAAFDHPLIKAHMPKLAACLAYYPFDIGIQRRVSRKLAGREIVNYAPNSYGDAKTHRAMDDAVAHLREAQSHRDFYRKLVENGAI